MWNVIFFMIVASLGLVIRSGTYVVDEGTQVVITQFGEIVGEPSIEPGIYFRVPLIQEAHYLEKRIETWQGYVDYIPTKDRQYVAVQTVAHWRIEDPILYMEALGRRELAKSRMDAIINGSVKDMVSSHAMVDTVRNSNRVVNEEQEATEQTEEGMANSRGLTDQLKYPVTSRLELVTVGRRQLTRKMFAEAAAELHKLGIDVVGLFVERVSYEPEVERKVYQRMISERGRIAERLKSLGRGERERILGQLAQDSNSILGPATREAEVIRGEADAGALALYADAFGRDPEFYNFWRSIQAYRNSLSASTTIITSTESNYYRRLFEDPNQPALKLQTLKAATLSSTQKHQQAKASGADTEVTFETSTPDIRPLPLTTQPHKNGLTEQLH